MAESRTRAVLDGRCHDPEHQLGDEYRMVARCENCGTEAVIRLTRGHRVGEISGPPCPYCGCTRWQGWRRPEEEGPADE